MRGETPFPADVSELFLLMLYIFNYTFISVHRCRLQAAVTFQTVTLLVLCAPRRSHYEGHSLSPRGPCECLKVLILHIQQSIQQAFFVLETFVPLVLTNKIMHSTKGYMPRFIDHSLKNFFYSCKSWQGKNQNQREKNLHVYLIQREVKKTSSELRGGWGELMND